ncbi:MAG: zinc ribbon domain-containing protein [Ruminococcaceae bacterium]|nr:zinc ribbon domain-containing protein [Oscillospiraceae bacterium]
MAYCINCGAQLQENSKFCASCGTPTNNDVHHENAKRKLVYDGEIHKCPSCGEALDSFVVVCPTCGYELRGASTSNSVREFAAKIDGAQTDTQRVNIIRSYPVPNTKEDIFEFIILASTNITGEQQKKVFDAWLVKFEQSYQKAQLVMKDSPDMARIKAIYDKTHKQINKEKLFRNAKAAGDTISKSSNLIGKIFLLIGKSAAVIAGIVLFIVAINIDGRGGNSSMHELIGVILLVASAATLTRRGASFLEILIGAGSGGLSFYLANHLNNGSMLQLGGAVVLIIVAISFFKKLAKKEDK